MSELMNTICDCILYRPRYSYIIQSFTDEWLSKLCKKLFLIAVHLISENEIELKEIVIPFNSIRQSIFQKIVLEKYNSYGFSLEMSVFLIQYNISARSLRLMPLEYSHILGGSLFIYLFIIN